MTRIEQCVRFGCPHVDFNGTHGFCTLRCTEVEFKNCNGCKRCQKTMPKECPFKLEFMLLDGDRK